LNDFVDYNIIAAPQEVLYGVI